MNCTMPPYWTSLPPDKYDMPYEYDTFDEVHKAAEKGTFWVDTIDKILIAAFGYEYDFLSNYKS